MAQNSWQNLTYKWRCHGVYKYGHYFIKPCNPLILTNVLIRPYVLYYLIAENNEKKWK